MFLKHFLAYIADLFSAKICVLTLFSPWKRDTISYEGLSLQEKFQVWILNLTSRLVGAVVKIFTLATFCIVFFLCFIFSVVIFLGWLLYPAILVGLAAWGIKDILIG